MSSEVDLSESIIVDYKHKHPNVLFVMAPSDGYTVVRKLDETDGDLIPVLSLRLETYVLLSALSLDLRDTVRAELIRSAVDLKRPAVT
jgi:hypothetical protein